MYTDFSLIIFLKFFVLGVVFGFVFEICKLVKLVCKNNLFIINTAKFVYFCVFGTYFCSFLLKICSGNVYLYAIIAAALGIILQQFSIGFLFTKFYKVLYNIFVKISRKIKNTKLGNKFLR